MLKETIKNFTGYKGYIEYLKRNADDIDDTVLENFKEIIKDDYKQGEMSPLDNFKLLSIYFGLSFLTVEERKELFNELS